MKRLIQIFIFILFPMITFGQVSIRNTTTDADTVLLGMCYLKDSLKTSFIITNNTNSAVKITQIDPSFYLGKPIGYPNDDFREFSRIPGIFPMLIDAKDTREITITYKADMDLVSFPVGIKYAMVRIGVFDADRPTEPPVDEMLAYKEVILKVKKTNLYIDTYLNNVQLDTVYVLPNDTLRYSFIYRNNINKENRIHSEQITYLNSNTFPNEIKIIKEDFSVDFTNYGEHKNRTAYYYPIDRGWDTIVYSLDFKPNEALYPDSTARSRIIFSAYGIEQRLKLADAVDAKINKDTIEIGEVRVGRSKIVKIIFQNRSNFPFGLNGQSILKLDSDVNDNSFIFNKFLLEGGRHLALDAYDTLTIEFIPNDTKEYTARLVFESDITRRKFFGVPNSAKNIQFYLKAKGVLPKLTLPSDTIDFRDVIMSANCPAVKDTIFRLFNPGNEKIRIERIEFEPPLSNPFHYEDTSFEILPNNYYDFKLSFHTAGLSVNNDYSTKIVFHTNSEIPFHRIEAELTASTVPLLNMNLSIPKNVRTKSGRIIKVPIIVEKNKIQYANRFSSMLSFNKTIIEYAGYEQIGTASEAARQISFSKLDESTIDISIVSNPDNFLPIDTLIYIKFNTYLGDAVITPLAFENPKFGNNNCDQVFTLDNSIDRNGSVIIDSICGINYKTLRLSSGKFALKNISPNPIIERAEITFQNPISQAIKIEVYNSSGDLATTILNTIMPAGEFSIEYNFKNIPSGAYIIKLSSANNQKIQQFNICR